MGDRGEQGHGGPSETPISESSVDPDAPAEDLGGAFDQREIFRAIEVVERDSFAIAQSFTSLFASLRLALSQGSLGATVKLSPCDQEVTGSSRENSLMQKCKVRLRTIHPKWSDPSLDPAHSGSFVHQATSNSVDHMQCFADATGRLQESVLDATTKGNRYINSCLRLNEEMKSVDGLASQLKILRRHVDALDSAVNKLLNVS